MENIKEISSEELKTARPTLEDISKMYLSDGKEDFYKRQAALALQRTIDSELNRRAVEAANSEGAKKIVYASSPVANASTKYVHSACGPTTSNKFLVNDTIKNLICQTCGKPLSKWAEIS